MEKQKNTLRPLTTMQSKVKTYHSPLLKEWGQLQELTGVGTGSQNEFPSTSAFAPAGPIFIGTENPQPPSP